MSSGTIAPRPVWIGHETIPVQLVLEGGSLRNLFTCGVLDFFLDRGFFAESVIGVSAGALSAYNYVAGAPGVTARINLQYRSDWRFASLRSYATTGSLIGTRFLCKTIPGEIEHLDHSWFSESPVRLTTVATNLETGKAEYHLHERGENADETTDWLIAGSALPYLSRPFELNGNLYMDGGVGDRIPFRRGQQKYRGKQVIVLTRSRDFVQPRTFDALVAPMFYGRYPVFVKGLVERPKTYVRAREAIEEARARGDLFVIQPERELDIGTVERDTGKLFAGYVAGLEEAARNWNALREYLEID